MRRINGMSWVTLLGFAFVIGVGLFALRVGLSTPSDNLSRQQEELFQKVDRASELFASQAGTGNRGAQAIQVMLAEKIPIIDPAVNYMQIAGLGRENAINLDLSVRLLPEESVAMLLIRPTTHLYLQRRGITDCQSQELQTLQIMSDFWEDMYGAQGNPKPYDNAQRTYNQLLAIRRNGRLPTAVASICQQMK